MHISNLTARGWPAGTAPLALRSSNGFQMAAASSVRGFRPEAASHRFLAQARSEGWVGCGVAHSLAWEQEEREGHLPLEDAGAQP